MDLFHEEVVIKRNQGVQNLMYGMVFVLMILCGGYALLMLNPLIVLITQGGFTSGMMLEIILVVAAVAIAVLLFLYKDRVKTEYEYTFTNGILDFAKVFNNKKRQALGSMNVKNVEACGLVSSGSFKRYSSMPGVKMVNWFLNREAELFYFYFVKDGVKKIIVIEPSETLADMIKRSAGSGKYQVN